MLITHLENIHENFQFPLLYPRTWRVFLHLYVSTQAIAHICLYRDGKANAKLQLER